MMEGNFQKKEHQGQPQIPKTLAEQRQGITPEESDDWFNSQQSDFSQQDSNGQEESKIQNTSNVLNSVISVSKEEQLQIGATKQKIQTVEKIGIVEKIESQKIVKQKFEQMQLQKQKEYKIFYHKLDEKLSLLLLKMQRFRLVNLQEISGLKENGKVELFHKNKQIIVRTTDKLTADEAINKLSDFVDDLNVLRLEVRVELIDKIQGFRKIKAQLIKRKIVLFYFENIKEQRGLYVGGMFKPSQLKKIQLQIKNYKIFSVKLRKYTNRRTYKIILDNILQSSMVKTEMMKLSSVNFLEVDIRNRNKEMQSKKEIPPTQYEYFLYDNITKFVVINFILKTEHYLPKLSVKQNAQIKFIYINEKNSTKRKITYLLIIAEIETFYKFYKEIESQIEKVGQLIFGVRFFNNLFPNFRNFKFDRDVYFAKRFPRINTYSMIVKAKQREGKKYYWRQTFLQFLEMKKPMQKEEMSQTSFIQQDQN